VDSVTVFRPEAGFFLQANVILHHLGFGGREEDQHGQFFADVVEAMADFRGHQNHATCGNFSILGSGLKMRAAADHV
jgi:hypothetical protein